MTDTVIVAIVAGVPGILTAFGTLVVILRTKRMQENVEKIEKQTNSMNSTMVDSARREGRQEGKERAEGVAAVTAANVASAPPPIPLVVAPGANQDDIVKYLAQGIAQGILMEKKRHATEGNGPR